MKHLTILATTLLTAACANPNIPPVDGPARNVISAGVGLASVMTTCGDGYQRSTPGVGAGLILTTCLSERPQPKDAPIINIPDGFGVVSVGAGLGVTVSDCGGFRLTGIGIGMGLVAAPCPKQPK